MIKKRILSIILCICLSMALSAPVYSEDSVPITAKQEEAYSVLRSLGFLSSYYDMETILEQDYVSRAVFAEVVYGIYNSANLKSENLYFHDVPKSHYAATAISSLTEQGVISVNDEKLFYPENYIKPIEAAKIIIYALGYENLAMQLGGYTVGIERLASDLRLFDGVSVSDKLSFFDMLVMIYNSISVELLEVKNIINDDSIEYTENNSTYLSKYHDIYVGKGVLKGYDGISVFGEKVGDGDALIDSIYFSECKTDVSEHLGKYVKYYYRITDELNELLWIGTTSKSSELVLEYVKNNVRFDSAKYAFTYYEEDGKRVTEEISKNASIVYNDSYLNNNVTEVLSGNIDKVKLVSTYGEEYNVVIVEDYESYVFESANLSDNIMYLKSCKAKNGKHSYETIELDTYERLEIVLANGNEGKLQDISVGTLISLEKSENSNRLKITVCDKIAEGIVSQVSDDGRYRIITLNDAEYVVADGIPVQIDVGDEVKLSLDLYGYVAVAEVKNTAVKFGYLIKTAKQSGIGDVLEFKIFDDSGEMIYIDSATRVKIDGNNISGTANIYRELGGGGISPQLIAFSLNAVGKVNMIDRAVDYADNLVLTPDNMLVKTQTLSGASFVAYNQNNLGPKVRIGDSTKFMSVPNDVNNADDERLFSIGKVASFSGDSTYSGDAFQYGLEPNEFTDVLVIKGKSLNSEYFVSTNVLITDVKKTLNSDGEIVYKLSGYHGNTFKELVCTTQLSANMPDIHIGDAITVTDYPNNIVNGFSVNAGPSAQTRLVDKTFKANGARKTMAYVHNVVGTSVYCGFDNGKTWEEIMTPGRASVFIYDSEKNKVLQGSLAELVSYKNAGDKCSEVYIYIVNGEVRNFIIYR